MCHEKETNDNSGSRASLEIGLDIEARNSFALFMVKYVVKGLFHSSNHSSSVFFAYERAFTNSKSFVIDLKGFSVSKDT